jgi:hypothetical protein
VTPDVTLEIHCECRGPSGGHVDSLGNAIGAVTPWLFALNCDICFGIWKLKYSLSEIGVLTDH